MTLNLVGYSLDLALYLVILGSLLVGFLIAGVLSSINSMFSAFKIMGKNNEINSSQKEVANLKEKINRLEIEITKLKTSQNSTS